MYYFKINKQSELGQKLTPLLVKAWEDINTRNKYVASITGANGFCGDGEKYGDLISVDQVSTELQNQYTKKRGDVRPLKSNKELCEKWKSFGTVTFYEVNHLLGVSDCLVKHIRCISMINPNTYDDYLYIAIQDFLNDKIDKRPDDLQEITKTEWEEKRKA